MHKKIATVIAAFFLFNQLFPQVNKAHNPVIFADVPDMSMIRAGNTYYMSSTTMHMSPGVPIMKSNDLVNWQIVNYCYDTLVNNDDMNLENGKSTYGRGSWAIMFLHLRQQAVRRISIQQRTSKKVHGKQFHSVQACMIILFFLMMTEKYICFMATGN
jgi:hypothetical protein